MCSVNYYTKCVLSITNYDTKCVLSITILNDTKVVLSITILNVFCQLLY